MTKLSIENKYVILALAFLLLVLVYLLIPKKKKTYEPQPPSKQAVPAAAKGFNRDLARMQTRELPTSKNGSKRKDYKSEEVIKSFRRNAKSTKQPRAD
ncbi:hypothetical protein KKC60_02725 [Patescibacteria group bacterium]|nr:hypothetical protein [Patescibacteria group bacterium]